MSGKTKLIRNTKLIPLTIAALALFAAPALASTFHRDGAANPTALQIRRDIPVQSHTVPGIKARVAQASGADAYDFVPPTTTRHDPTMQMLRDQLPVQDHQLPGYGARP